MVELKDRYRGSLLGLAAGDALGTTLEFKAPLAAPTAGNAARQRKKQSQ